LSWLQTTWIALAEALSSPWSGSTGRLDWPGGAVAVSTIAARAALKSFADCAGVADGGPLAKVGVAVAIAEISRNPAVGILMVALLAGTRGTGSSGDPPAEPLNALLLANPEH
jgi:hypothetical protein